MKHEMSSMTLDERASAVRGQRKVNRFATFPIRRMKAISRKTGALEKIQFVDGVDALNVGCRYAELEVIRKGIPNSSQKLAGTELPAQAH
jgi:hypothetical protein